MKEKTLKSREIYRGSFLDFYEDIIEKEDGQTAKRVVIRHPGAAAILALDDRGNILLTQQFRYPIDAYTLEIPAGKIDQDESSLMCAIRELEEETGYHPETIEHVMFFHPCLGYSDEGIDLYLAKNCKKVDYPRHMDDDESIDVVLLNPHDIAQMLESGTITDGKTWIALLYYLNHQEKDT